MLYSFRQFVNAKASTVVVGSFPARTVCWKRMAEKRGVGARLQSAHRIWDITLQRDSSSHVVELTGFIVAGILGLPH